MRDESKRFDVRVIERNLRRGWITRKDLDKHLKSLPDSTDSAVWTRLEVEPAPQPDFSPPSTAGALPPKVGLLGEDDDEDLDDDEEDDEDDEDEEDEAE